MHFDLTSFFLKILWRCYTTQNRAIDRTESKRNSNLFSYSESPLALETLAATVSNVLRERGRQNVASCTSDGELTVSDESDETELSEDEIAEQTQRNSSLIQQYMAESYLNESDIRFADGPFEGEPITVAAPPRGNLLHMPDEGDVACPYDVQFQPCSARDVGLFVDIWAIVTGRGAELGQSRFEPGALIEAVCARHATLLLAETCVSLLFVAAIESERAGRGQFLNDVRYLTVLTWQEHARRLFESKGANVSADSSRRRSAGVGDAEGDSALEDMCAQITQRDFHLMDIDCKVTVLRCLLLACTQPTVSLQKVELKSCISDPRPKRQAAKNYLAGLEAIGVTERDAKRKKTGNGGITDAIDCSSISTSHLLGRGAALGSDRHGNRFYQIPSDPGRILCESYNKMWWMMYETSSHISSLLQYLHPSGQEEQILLHAIVSRRREISAGISARFSRQPADEHVENKKPANGKIHKNKAAAAASTGLVVADWLVDVEGSFVARQLTCMSASPFISSISSCVAPGVGYCDASSCHDGPSCLFRSPDALAEADLLCDSEEHLVAKHWLSVFLRRRQFSNQLRLYHNSLYFSGFRSLCAQAHIVNRLLSPLTGSSPTNSCFVELRSASKAECADSPKHTSDVNAADDCAVNLPPEDVSGLRANEWESTHMPGVYDPVMFLKAHALRLFETIISVLKSSFEGERSRFQSACIHEL